MPTTAPSDVIISAPTLEPWQPLQDLFCRQCGHLAPGRISQFVAMLQGKVPQRLYGVTWCAGGKPPVEDIANPIEAMLRGNSESRPVCGGVAEAHLHLTCCCCGHLRLMRIRSWIF